MKSRKPTGFFAPYEIQRFIRPISIASVIVVVLLILESVRNPSSLRNIQVIYGCILVAGTLINDITILRTTNFRDSYGWLNAILTGLTLGVLPYILPISLAELPHILIIFGILAVAIVSGRPYGFTTLAIILLVGLPFLIRVVVDLPSAIYFGVPYIVSIVAMEAVLRIKDTTQQHIHRLETINKVSRQIMLSLETQQTISILNATMQDTLEADTYFVGILKNDEIHLDLFYDDGEYYNGMTVPLEGTLSGWVIKNQKELFLPDLRKEVDLEGVDDFVIGREKTSLSWMGVPLTAANVTGVLALASYQPNAFDSADMQLLSNLAQHIALALDNTIRHAHVEEQARLDSLTGVYNHGYFLKKLAEQAKEASTSNIPLSLIMLDVDFFKQFNDAYGHLLGDRILKTLCTAIKHHIKQSDAVGRWGGEEFIISLPGANGKQALQVAERIGQTMAILRVEDREQRTIRIPTVSQGIAVFPGEADEIYRLIDLADRRLYIAKGRGRNQVEPGVEHWQNLQN